jgi:hypothetical protein
MFQAFEQCKLDIGLLEKLQVWHELPRHVEQEQDGGGEQQHDVRRRVQAAPGAGRSSIAIG